jgi:hypothetical protein
MSPRPHTAGPASSSLDDAALAKLLAAGTAASAFAIEPSSRAGALTYLRALADAAARIEDVDGVEEGEPAETFVP